MEWLINLFNSLTPAMQAYWVMTMCASVGFMIQITLTLTNTETNDPTLDTGEISAILNPLRFFSLPNFISFLTGFGWGSIFFYQLYTSPLKISLYAAGVGLTITILIFLLVKRFLRLRHIKPWYIEDSIGLEAEVYRTIPGIRKGKGKITVYIKNTAYKINAMTNGIRLPAGSIVKIIQVIDNQTVLVAQQ